MTRIKDRSDKTCPVCGDSVFEPTEETLNLLDVLRRWEKEAAVSFSPVIWEEYGPPALQHLTLYRCEQCSFGMFQPVVVGSEHFYEAITAKDGQCYSEGKWEFRQAIDDIKKHGSRRVLDIGSGSGYFLDMLRASRAVTDYIGYEFNHEMAELIREKGHNVCYGPFPEAVLTEAEKNPFDAISMFQILEHVADPVEYLQTVRGLLRPRGILVVGVPNAAGPIRHFSSALTEIPPHHVSQWRESVFRVGASRLGFRLLRVAREPLPSYLWGSYLPVMLENDLKPGFIGKTLNKTGMTNLLMRVLTHLRVRWLRGVPGHSLYVLLEREDAGQ